MPDIWSQWLLHQRHADDPAFAAAIRDSIASYENRALDAAQLAPGDTLLDAGAGEGHLAWRAIARLGPDLKVILADISAPLLAYAAAQAKARHIADQCQFIETSIETLAGIPDASVDAVTTRAALAYAADKPAAFAALHRVLKPGGRISLAEPVFRDDAYAAAALKTLAAAQPDNHLTRLLHRWKAAQFPDTPEAIAATPITNYGERDLIGYAQAAGFIRLHMELHIDIAPTSAPSWEAFLDMSPHPLASPLRTIMENASSEERAILEQHLRPGIEAGMALSPARIVYLSAQTKPAAAH
jgi:ubiquinone/menaquinone biosynthesis C-methylase UbiE